MTQQTQSFAVAHPHEDADDRVADKAFLTTILGMLIAATAFTGLTLVATI